MGKKDGKKIRREHSATETGRRHEVAAAPRPWLMSQQAALRLLVFTAGSVLMGLEIVGSRVLAPHFGNSVFVWGSLISVFLIALAAGYYLGGHLADRHPAMRLLNAICVLVALWIVALTAVGHPICANLVTRGLGEQLGPLLASTILFLPPSVGLGLLSPLSVRIAATSLSSVGQVAGTLYALSTLGSIAGTLLATFVLIPSIGVAAILKLLAGVLLVAAVITLPGFNSRFGRAFLVLACLIALAGWLLPASSTFNLTHGDTVRVDEHSPYHHISVIDNSQRNTRQLQFDKYIETGIQLTPPYRSLEDYTNYFHLAFLLRPKMERVLFIGAGGGVGPRTFLAHDPDLKIDVVDIDPRVLAIAREYFYLPDTPAIRLAAEDGRMFLRHADEVYDSIVLDAFTIGGRIPFHLVTHEFFELCRERLSPDGVFLMNFGSALDGPRSGIYRTMIKTVGSVFTNVYVFPLAQGGASSLETTNIVIVATNERARLDAADWAARAQRYKSESYVDTRMMLQMVGELLGEGVPDPHAPMLTDDYSPLETMPF